LASTLLVLCISYATRFGDTLFRQAFWPFLLGLAFFAGGFWTTLLFRQITSAFWFTLLIPLAILVGTTHLLDNRSQVVQELAVGAVLVVYAVAGFLWARRQFLYAQDTGWTGGTISLPTVRSYGSIVPVAARVHTQRPVRA